MGRIMSSDDTLFVQLLKSNKKIISFDIFDTLIERIPGSSTALFDCVEQKAKASGFLADGFAKNRIQAEQSVRLKSGQEIGLNDIYRELETCFGFVDADELKKIEVQAEIDLCIANVRTKETFCHLLEQRKRVVLTTDMYLPRDVLETILLRNGITGYEALFVSSEVGCRKEDGTLFRYLCDKLAVEPSDVVHVGDNPNSDVLQPSAMGIDAIQIREGTLVNTPIFAQRIAKRVRSVFFKRKEEPGFTPIVDDPGANLGMTALGPLLFGFCNWLHRELEATNVDTVLFMSRDGLLLKRAYEILYPDDQTVYMYGSRRSVIVPTLWKDPTIEGVLRALPLGGSISIGSFLERIGLSYESVAGIAQRFGYERATMVNPRTICDDTEFSAFYSEIESLVSANSLNEYKAYSQYLQSIFKAGGRYAFVDIGWNGYMQKALCDILSAEISNVEVFGFYTALRPRSPIVINGECSMRGFLFDKGRNEKASDRQELYNALYEVVFSADHGTVEKFVEVDSGLSAPVLLERERDAVQQQAIDAIQELALAFVGVARDRNLDSYLNFEPLSLLKPWDRIGLNPTLLESLTLGKLTIYEYGTSSLVDARGLSEYLRGPVRFVKDFGRSYWKAGFLRTVFRLPAPYSSLIRLLRCCRKALRCI